MRFYIARERSITLRYCYALPLAPRDAICYAFVVDTGEQQDEREECAGVAARCYMLLLFERALFDNERRADKLPIYGTDVEHTTTMKDARQ